MNLSMRDHAKHSVLCIVDSMLQHLLNVNVVFNKETNDYEKKYPNEKIGLVTPIPGLVYSGIFYKACTEISPDLNNLQNLSLFFKILTIHSIV